MSIARAFLFTGVIWKMLLKHRTIVASFRGTTIVIGKVPMRFCFVQKSAMTYFGVMSLAGYLNKTGHTFSVVIDSLEKNACEELRKLRPDLIGISVITSEHGWLIDICKKIKSVLPDVPIIIGGIHAIMYPEILSETSADFLCKCVEVAIHSGATVINVPDTVGYSTPQEYYEIIKMLTPPADATSDFPPGDFVEYDLDGEGRLVPVDRPYGKNAANLVVGVLRLGQTHP